MIKVRAASVNPLDWKTLTGGPYLIRMLLGLGKPKVRRIGVDVAGQVEEVGKNVTRFKPGDKVFGTCRGAFAEYTCASDPASVSKLVIKPDNVTFEQAAAAPIAGLTALQGLRDKGRVQPGQRVLINGAAGGVGTFAVQIAKSFGADVTGVCSTRNVDMVRSIGADRVIDYTQEDFTTGGERYDVLLDCVGNHSFRALRRVLNPKGVFVIIGAPHDVGLLSILAGLIGTLALAPFVSQKVAVFIAKSNAADLTVLGELMASGRVKPVMDTRHGLTAVPEALQYLNEGHARGKVVISLEDSDRSDRAGRASA